MTDAMVIIVILFAAFGLAVVVLWMRDRKVDRRLLEEVLKDNSELREAVRQNPRLGRSIIHALRRDRKDAQPAMQAMRQVLEEGGMAPEEAKLEAARAWLQAGDHPRGGN